MITRDTIIMMKSAKKDIDKLFRQLKILYNDYNGIVNFKLKD